MDTTTTLLDEVRALAPGFEWQEHNERADEYAATADGVRILVWRDDGEWHAAAWTSGHPIDDAGVGVRMPCNNGVPHPTLAAAVGAVVTAHRNRNTIIVGALRAALALAKRQSVPAMGVGGVA